MATPTTIANQINWLSKDFLWGFDLETDKQNTPLVAWNCLTPPREDGGMGFKNYTANAKALLSRWVSQSMEDMQSNWAVSFMGIMKAFT